jgi:hypothetical protein
MFSEVRPRCRKCLRTGGAAFAVPVGSLPDAPVGEQEGDQELVDFFGGILENNLRAAQSAKDMLVSRIQNEQE